MIIEDLIDYLGSTFKHDDSAAVNERLCQLRQILSDRKANNDSLRNYIADMKIDEIEDDMEFMEAEHDAVFDYCCNKKFMMTRDDMRVIRARGLIEAFEEWSR